jgi:hypothetical protein
MRAALVETSAVLSSGALLPVTLSLPQPRRAAKNAGVSNASEKKGHSVFITDEPVCYPTPELSCERVK